MMTSIIMLLFLVSGATGLGYQVLWSKYILDFIGVSAYSYATVLAAFMAGLALGSKYIGRWADRFRSPLKLYAFLELGIGLYAILYLPLTGLAASLYGRWVQYTPEYAGAGYGVWAKILISGLILIPPTVLMGGTFPAMLRHATENLGAVGRRSSQFYSINAFGAAGGGLVMGFILMPALGMRASLMSLAMVNGLVGLIAYLLAKEVRSDTSRVEGEAAAVKADPGFVPPSLSGWQVRLGLLFVFIAGILAFSYEIAWTRFFGIVLGSSTYSFSIMLAAFITGIAAGSAWLVRLNKKITHPMQFFGWTQIVAALLVLLPVTFYPYLPWVFGLYGGLLSAERGAFYLYELGKLSLCFLVMFPPTVFLGMSIPLVIRGMSKSLTELGQDTGRIYAWNTWGNVLGAFAAGLLLLPLLGMERLITWTAVGNALLGLGTITAYAKKTKETKWVALAKPAGAVAAVLVVLMVSGSWDHRLLALQAFRRQVTTRTWEAVERYISPRTVLYVKDDPAASLMVIEQQLTEPLSGVARALYVSGKPDASSYSDLPTQLLSAHIPLLLHSNPRDVLIVGLASGVTAGAALSHDVERVDVVELVRAMPEATRFFNEWNGDPFSDPRFNEIYDDGRSYISYTSQKYDVIISEPSNPWMAGVGAIFTTDHFRRAVQALKPDGLYLQWLQGYRIGDATFASVVRSFRRVFPHVYGFQGCFTDMFFIGSLKPLELDLAGLSERLKHPRVRESLARLEIHDLQTLLSFQVFSPLSMDFIASLTYMENTDDNHLLEYRAPRDLFQTLTPTLITQRDERLISSPSLAWSQWVRSRDTEPQILPTLTAMSRRSVTFAQLQWVYQMAHYHAASLDLISGPLEINQHLPEDFWRTSPLTLEQITSQIDRFLELDQAALAYTVVERFYSVMLLEAALSSTMADFWIENAERWYERASEEAKPVLRNLLIDLFAATGQTERYSRLLVEALQSPEPPAADWAVLRACRLDNSFCYRVVAHYLRSDPERWLQNFQALRFPQSAEHMGLSQ